MDSPIERLGGRQVYENAWMTVREDQVRRADGSLGIYGVVDKPDFALVVPREADGSLWLVEQFRYPVGRRAWEFPQGTWGAGATGSRAELAAAELREETGLHAGSLTPLGHLFAAYGFCSQGFDVYLAEQLEHGTPDREVTEADMVHRRFSPQEFTTLVRTGGIVDGASLAAAYLLELASPERSEPNRSSAD